MSSSSSSSSSSSLMQVNEQGLLYWSTSTTTPSASSVTTSCCWSSSNHNSSNNNSSNNNSSNSSKDADASTPAASSIPVLATTLRLLNVLYRVNNSKDENIKKARAAEEEGDGDSAEDMPPKLVNEKAEEENAVDDHVKQQQKDKAASGEQDDDDDDDDVDSADEEQAAPNGSGAGQEADEEEEQQANKDDVKDDDDGDGDEAATTSSDTKKEKDDEPSNNPKQQQQQQQQPQRRIHYGRNTKQQQDNHKLVEDASMQHFTRVLDVASLMEVALHDIQHYRQRSVLLAVVSPDKTGKNRQQDDDDDDDAQPAKRSTAAATAKNQAAAAAADDGKSKGGTTTTTGRNNRQRSGGRGGGGGDKKGGRGGGGGGGRVREPRSTFNRNEQRMQALEHQRDRRRLEQEKTKETIGSSNIATNSGSCGDDTDIREEGDNVDHDDEDEGVVLNTNGINNKEAVGDKGSHSDEERPAAEEEEEEAEVVELSWHRLGRTLNSLTILTPILLAAFSHERRNDKTLCIRSSSSKGSRDRHQITHDIVNGKSKKRSGGVSCWLFFEQTEPSSLHVFDMTGVKNCRLLYHKLLHIWSMLFYGLAAAPTTKRQRYVESIVLQHDQDRVVAQLSSHWRPVMNTLMQQVCRLQAVAVLGESGGGGDSENDADVLVAAARQALSSWSNHGWIGISSPLLSWHNEQNNGADGDEGAAKREVKLDNHHGYHPLAKLDSESKQRLAVYAQQLDVHVGFSNNDKNKDAKEMLLQEQYQQAIDNLHRRTLELLRNRFAKSSRNGEVQLSVYGSCYSNLSIQNSDVDMSLHLPEMLQIEEAFLQQEYTVEKYDAERRKLVYQACRKLENHVGNNTNNSRHLSSNNNNNKNGQDQPQPEYRNMQPITRARVPVIKGTFLHANNPYSHDGSMDFDICFCNEIAVQNSRLLREYSLVNTTTSDNAADNNGGGVVRQVMMAVKHWAKANQISSAADQTLSSYTWMNLVIYYLQYVGLVPNLQCPMLQKQVAAMRQASGSDKSQYDQGDSAITAAANDVNSNKDRNQTMQDPSTDGLDISFVTWKEAQQVWMPPPCPPAALCFLQPSQKTGDDDEDDDRCSVSMYLYGFFYFYTHVFPVTMFVISIRRGGGSCSSPSTSTTDRNGGDNNNNNLLLLPKTAFCRGTNIACCMNSFSIEDPFERYDSHRPHDLFSPADERGFQRIAQCFHQAEAEWRTLLVQLAAVTAETNCKDDIGSDETSSSDNEDVADKVKTKLMMDMASNWHRRAAVVADSANKTQKGKQQQNGINDKVQPKNTPKKQKQLPRKGGNQHHNGNRGKPHVAPQNAPLTRGQQPQHQRDDGGRTGVGNDRINKKTVSTSNHVPVANGRNHEKGQSSRNPGNKVRSSNDAVGTNEDLREKGKPSSADKGTASGGRGDVASASATTSKVDAAPTTANAARDDANAMHQSANGNSNSGQKRNRGNRSRGGGRGGLGGRGGRGGRGRSQQQQQQ